MYMYITGYTLISTGYDRIYCLMNAASSTRIHIQRLFLIRHVTGASWFKSLYNSLASCVFSEHRSRVLYYTHTWMGLDVLCNHMLIARLFSWMGIELFSILYRPRLVYTCFESSAPFKKASQYSTLLHTYECSVMYMYSFSEVFFIREQGSFPRLPLLLPRCDKKPLSRPSQHTTLFHPHVNVLSCTPIHIARAFFKWV